MEYKLKSPVIFETDETLQFSNTAHFHADVLAVVFKSRHNFSSEKMGMNLKEMLKQGYGFYVTLTHIQIKKPLKLGETFVKVKSYIDKYLQAMGSTRVHVPFEIKEGDDLIANGFVEFAVVDTRLGKGRHLPIEDWRYFSYENTQKGPAVVPADKNTYAKPKVCIPEDAVKTKRKVKDSEIDMYNHVGTTNYLRYIFDTLENPEQYNQSTFMFKRSLLKENYFTTLIQKESNKVFFEIKSDDLKTLYNVGLLECE